MTVMEYHNKYLSFIGQALTELDADDAACFMAMIRQTSTESLVFMSRASGTPMKVFDQMAESYAGMLAKSANNLGLEL